MSTLVSFDLLQLCWRAYTHSKTRAEEYFESHFHCELVY